MATDLPSRIGPYPVTELIGREGSALLYRATNPANGRPVVAHLLSPRLAEEPQLLARFRRDGAALARSPHPNVLQVIAVGEEDGRPYLITEPFPGAPLDEVLHGRRLTVPEAFTVMNGLCRALAHAHQNGVLHEHVWPHALRVSPDFGTVKLTDFGFARAEALGMTGTLSTGALNLGAFRYLAPEQTESRPGAPPDHRADLYSAGAVFQEILTGRPPGGRVALPSQVNSELPPETDVLILKCLARHPRERYATALDLLADLGKLEEATRVRVISELRGIQQAGSQRRTLLLAGAVLLVVLAIVVFLLLRH